MTRGRMPSKSKRRRLARLRDWGVLPGEELKPDTRIWEMESSSDEAGSDIDGVGRDLDVDTGPGLIKVRATSRGEVITEGIGALRSIVPHLPLPKLRGPREERVRSVEEERRDGPSWVALDFDDGGAWVARAMLWLTRYTIQSKHLPYVALMSESRTSAAAAGTSAW